MGYLKNKTFGFYLSFVAAILALIGFVMYRQSGFAKISDGHHRQRPV